MYVHVERERERELYTYMDIYIALMYIHIYVERERDLYTHMDIYREFDDFQCHLCPVDWKRHYTPRPLRHFLALRCIHIYIEKERKGYICVYRYIDRVGGRRMPFVLRRLEAPLCTMALTPFAGTDMYTHIYRERERVIYTYGYIYRAR